MTMVAGSVDRTSIDPATGVASSATGFAGVVYAWMVAYFGALSPAQPPAAPTIGSTASPFSAARPATADDVAKFNAGRLVTFQFWADQSNALAQVIVYVLANGHAHVTAEQLGRVPSGGVGTAIDAPAAPVDIPIT
jgi:hypothetical protein